MFFQDLDLNILPSHSRMSALELAQKLSSVKNHDARHLLVDVRNEAEFNMCRIDGAVNRPMDRLQGKKFQELLDEVRDYEQVTFVCRRGNDSQVVAKKVLDVIGEGHVNRVNDLNGGLHAWAKYVDANFPVY